MIVHYIDIQYLKSNSNIEWNVDDNKLTPLITDAHLINLQESLGTTMFNDLNNNYLSNSLSADELTLIKDYIKPMLLNWTLYYAIPFINYKLTNKAVSKEDSEYSQPSDLADIKYLRNDIKYKAEFYTNRLVDYLTANSNKFPKFNEIQPGDVKSRGSDYGSGIFLGGRRGCDPFYGR